MYPFEQFPEIKTSVYFSRCIWQLQSITVEWIKVVLIATSRLKYVAQVQIFPEISTSA
jgi:hypothetical protein